MTWLVDIFAEAAAKCLGELQHGSLGKQEALDVMSQKECPWQSSHSCQTEEDMHFVEAV